MYIYIYEYMYIYIYIYLYIYMYILIYILYIYIYLCKLSVPSLFLTFFPRHKEGMGDERGLSKWERNEGCRRGRLGRSGQWQREGEGVVAKWNWSEVEQVRKWGVDGWEVAWETQEFYFIQGLAFSHTHILVVCNIWMFN